MDTNLGPAKTLRGVGHLTIRVYPYHQNVTLGKALEAKGPDGLVQFSRPPCFWRNNAFNEVGSGTYVMIEGCDSSIKRYLAANNGYERQILNAKYKVAEIKKKEEVLLEEQTGLLQRIKHTELERDVARARLEDVLREVDRLYITNIFLVVFLVILILALVIGGGIM